MAGKQPARSNCGIHGVANPKHALSGCGTVQTFLRHGVARDVTAAQLNSLWGKARGFRAELNSARRTQSGNPRFFGRAILLRESHGEECSPLGFVECGRENK